MKLKQIKVRVHRALFDNNLPFRARSEKLKTRYNRKVKHRNLEKQ